MAKILVQVPEAMGLSDEQIKELQQKFVSHVVDSVRAKAGEIAAAAKAKAEVVHVEVIAI